MTATRAGNSIMLLTLSILAPIFGMFMLGAALARGDVLSVDNVGALLKLVTWVALPALLFRAVVNGGGGAADLRVAVVYLAACAVLLAVGMVVARLALGLKLAESTLFGMGAIYSNSSLIGVPIAQALLGHEGVQILAAIIAVHTLVLVPLATVLIGSGGQAASSRIRVALKSALLNPMTLALIAGFAWRLVGVPLPGILSGLINPLADATAPVALVALGATIVRTSWSHGLSSSTMVAAAMKLVLHPLLVWYFARIAGLSGEATLIATVTAALPPGVNVYVIACHFGRQVEETARSFALSTTLSGISVAVVMQLLIFR